MDKLLLAVVAIGRLVHAMTATARGVRTGNGAATVPMVYRPGR